MATATTGVALVAGIAVPASASSPDPWQPFHEQPFTQPAGAVCPFALHGDIVADHTLVRALQTYPDGSPREQEFAGPLVIRFTNLSTGTSVQRNLTGNGYLFYQPDGTILGHGLGHLAIGVHAGNTSPPPGEYVLISGRCLLPAAASVIKRQIKADRALSPRLPSSGTSPLAGCPPAG